MPDASIFQIENGIVTFALVDTTDASYDESWQAPKGKTLANILPVDYSADAILTNWSCQITSGMLTPSQNANDITISPTFCNPGKVIPQPSETSFTLDLEFLQQITQGKGLDSFLFVNDTLEAYFLLALAGEVTTPTPATNKPKAIGRCRLAASAFGGPAREQLTATVSLQLSRRPDIAYGSGATVTLAEGFTPPPREPETVAA